MSPSGNPFALSNEDFLKDLHVNLVGAYATLRETVQGFHSVGPSSAEPRVFIATGNVVPFQPHPAAITLGSGKAALAHLIEVGLQAYGEKGYRYACNPITFVSFPNWIASQEKILTNS